MIRPFNNNKHLCASKADKWGFGGITWLVTKQKDFFKGDQKCTILTREEGFIFKLMDDPIEAGRDQLGSGNKTKNDINRFIRRMMALIH